MPRLFLLLAVLCTPLIVGCDGCRNDSANDPSDESSVNVQDFTAGMPKPFPSGENRISSGIKPGHWLTASQSLKSNNADSRGEMNSLSGVGGKNWSESKARENGSMLTVRPVVMPKGQTRDFDYRTFVPPLLSGGSARGFLTSRFVSSVRSESFATGASPFSTMGSAEYFMVVLTERPQRFSRFQVSDWARPLRNTNAMVDSNTPVLINYRIVVPTVEGVLPLSETMLDWTNTAVVFWDDLPPEVLTPQQQTALADWVHYGGQLIVNGASAADAISKTGLIDLLPLKPTSNIELDSDAAAELLKGWQVPKDPSTEKQVALLKSQSSRVAVDGIAKADAETLANSGNLVLSCRAGSGRVVQSRFDLTSDWLTTWKSYDSFVNSVLLLRPPRELQLEDSELSEDPYYTQKYIIGDAAVAFADSAMNTRFRITSRDAALAYNRGSFETITTGITSKYDPLTRVNVSSGIGGWSDVSDVMRVCRETLRTQSGIEIPDSSLVIRSLGYYLLILVPLNYLIFRIMGRLEYAWLAVPVIAMGGAVWVAREARLDIGFARSQAELGLLEVQADCDRAHLTRVVAIYNSLASSYDIEFDTNDAVAMPIRHADTESPISAVFKTGFANGPILSGMVVGSNQVRMLHAEQMISLGGSLSMDANGNLLNGTDHELFDAIVVRSDLSGALEVANVGPCPGNSNQVLRFRPATNDQEIQESMSEEATDLEKILLTKGVVPLGSTRLVACLGEHVPGMNVTPTATQVTSKTVVLAHLEYAPWPVAVPDVNLRKENKPVLKDSDFTPRAETDREKRIIQD